MGAEFNRESIAKLKQLSQESLELIQTTKRGVQSVSDDTREMNIGAMNRNMDALTEAVDEGVAKYLTDLAESIDTAVKSYDKIYANLD